MPRKTRCFSASASSKGYKVRFTRLCVGCHDTVSTRSGDVSLKAKRGVTCLGCHDVDRQIRAGGNGDLEATPHDWSQDHKAWALASLEKLRQPEFCGGCHMQFVPGTGLVAIGTLDEYHASTYAPATRCVDCHMRKSNGVADHRFPGGNVYMGQLFGDDTLVNADREPDERPDDRSGAYGGRREGHREGPGRGPRFPDGRDGHS
jgi:hypothetical protein